MIKYFFILFLCLFSCSKDYKNNDDTYARVGNTVLSKQNIINMKEDGFVRQGSIVHIVDSWVEKTLLYNAAIEVGLNKDKNLLNKRDDFYKNLLISTFLEIESKKNIKISKKEFELLQRKQEFLR